MSATSVRPPPTDDAPKLCVHWNDVRNRTLYPTLRKRAIESTGLGVGGNHGIDAERTGVRKEPRFECRAVPQLQAARWLRLESITIQKSSLSAQRKQRRTRRRNMNGYRSKDTIERQTDRYNRSIE